MKKPFKLITSLAAISLALTACGGGSSAVEVGGTWDEIVQNAKDEGSVTYYVSGNEDGANSLAEAFTEEYGINVDVVYLTSNELSKRISAEVKSGNIKGDVINLAEMTLMDELAEGDQFLPLQGPSIDAIPAEAKNEHYYQVSRSFLSALYRDDVEKAPKTWEDFLDPQFKGKLGFEDPTVSTTQALGHHWLNKNVDNFMPRLGDQDPQLTQSMATSIPMLKGGQLDAVIFPAGFFTMAQAEENDDLEAVIPTPGLYYARYSAVPTGSPNPNAALVLNDFLASCDGQSIVNGNRMGTSAFCENEGDIEFEGEQIDLWEGVNARVDIQPTLDDFTEHVSN